MALKFYTSVEKGLKLKVKKFWWLIPTFLEVTGEKLVECGGEGEWQGGWGCSLQLVETYWLVETFASECLNHSTQNRVN